MPGIWAVARRELFSLWVTPLAWLLLTAFLLMNGVAFVATLGSVAGPGSSGIDLGPIQAYFGQSVFVPLGYLVVCPLLSMRALGEERRMGTAELLLSAPLSATDIVLGKYVALAFTYVAMWLPTVAYPFILRDSGQIEWSVVATSYSGAVGLGLGLLAVGLLASALWSHQLLAALATGTVIFALLLCGVGEQLQPTGALHELMHHLSIQSQLAECAQGILSLRRCTVLVTLTALPLFLAIRSVEAWRDG